ncbi:MAG TPA: hypothetical protein VFD92_09815 [Candidatus Binatia bacterium]|nr:hypothetical protein [Candidatus Binatia bacterium]
MSSPRPIGDEALHRRVGVVRAAGAEAKDRRAQACGAKQERPAAAID